MSIADSDIAEHNSQFLRSRGRLRVFCAPDATILVRGGGEVRQVCQIGYSSDGSVRVQWPYVRIRQGIVAPVVIPSVSGSMTIDLRATGRFTSQLVKFSHHASGATHLGHSVGSVAFTRRCRRRLLTSQSNTG